MNAGVGIIGLRGDANHFAKGIGDDSALADEAGGVIVFRDDQDGNVAVVSTGKLTDHDGFGLLDEGIDDGVEQSCVIPIHSLFAFFLDFAFGKLGHDAFAAEHGANGIRGDGAVLEPFHGKFFVDFIYSGVIACIKTDQQIAVGKLGKPRKDPAEDTRSDLGPSAAAFGHLRQSLVLFHTSIASLPDDIFCPRLLYLIARKIAIAKQNVGSRCFDRYSKWGGRRAAAKKELVKPCI